MRVLKWVLLIVLAALIVAFLHYFLPSRDIVRIVGTDVKRMDNSGSRDTEAPGTVPVSTRDVRFINGAWPGGGARVYRNEDTDWSWPPYLKFDSGNLQAEAQAMVSTEASPIYIVVTHYGWRITLLSMFPNAVDIRRADGPDETLIPWFNIVLLSSLAALIWMTLSFLRRLRERHVDPVIDGVEDAVSDFTEAADDHADAARDQAMGLWERWRRWLDTWRPKNKRRYR